MSNCLCVQTLSCYIFVNHFYITSLSLFLNIGGKIYCILSPIFARKKKALLVHGVCQWSITINLISMQLLNKRFFNWIKYCSKAKLLLSYKNEYKRCFCFKKVDGGRQLQDKEDLLDCISHLHLPVHLAVGRKRCYSKINYYHHFLVEEINGNTVKIIQNGKDRKSFLFSTVPFTAIHRKSVNLSVENNLFDFSSGVFLVMNDNYPRTIEQCGEAMQRALSRIGQRRYLLSTNNCEHFVTYVMTGKPYCTQLEKRSYFFKFFVYSIDCLSVYTTIFLISL